MNEVNDAQSFSPCARARILAAWAFYVLLASVGHTHTWQCSSGNVPFRMAIFLWIAAVLELLPEEVGHDR